ncbi:alpha/beta-hydrolase domain-containing protein [Striga asiatica]|uniref:Alpha/beta-hydrolase domain-containing protein n=1 Tax=Striga asiatica TaxID=4170 RepID=A0A5A7P434_STRAF|nr:alpha/beta-hydrolase domain-containing protein [Striga asiatica]
MDCYEEILETPAIAYELLFKSVAAIPLSHYLVGTILFLVVFWYNFLEFHLFQDLFTGFRGGPVLLTYNPSSEIYHGVVAKCRALHGRFIQVTFCYYALSVLSDIETKQMFHAPDGGTFALDWLLHSDVVHGVASPNNHAIAKDDKTPIVVMIPGLTSDSASPSDCFYNAGWTEDARRVINHLHHEYSEAPLFVVGTSIGANILVKYLGEDGENVPIAGAAAVCCPWDLLIGSRFISRRLIQKLYDRALTIGLQGYAQLHETRYSRLANWEGIKKSRSIRDFDTHATCLVGNYETVDTYYRRCSSSAFIGQVSVPLLCISALDDPVCTREAIPWDECRANKNVVLATTQHGGHLAFFEGISGSRLWWVRAVNEYLGALLSSSLMHTQKAENAGPHSPPTQSSIDQGPYLNVADGMVAAMGNDLTEGVAEKNSHDDDVDDDHVGQIVSAAENESGPTSISRKPDFHPSENGGYSKSSSGFIERCFYQISRQSNKSVWLLAYIAVISSWPIVGAAFGFLFKRKFKKVLPAKVPK